MSMSSTISKFGRKAICCCFYKHVIIFGDMVRMKTHAYHVSYPYVLSLVTNSEYQHTLPEAITQTCIVVFSLLVMEYICIQTLFYIAVVYELCCLMYPHHNALPGAICCCLLTVNKLFTNKYDQSHRVMDIYILTKFHAFI